MLYLVDNINISVTVPHSSRNAFTFDGKVMLWFTMCNLKILNSLRASREEDHEVSGENLIGPLMQIKLCPSGTVVRQSISEGSLQNQQVLQELADNCLVLRCSTTSKRNV